MSHPAREPSPLKHEEPPSSKKATTESPLAFNKPSETGGFLTSEERGGWDWFFFIITFQWVGAYFTAKAESKERESLLQRIQDSFPKLQSSSIRGATADLSYVETKNLSKVIEESPLVKDYILTFPPNEQQAVIKQLLANPTKVRYVFQLFGVSQHLLNGRIPKESFKQIANWMLTGASNEWLGNFEAYLQEAFRLESFKPDTFLLSPSKETEKLTNTLHPKLLGEIVEQPLIANLLTEMQVITTAANLDGIAEAITEHPKRAHPYLHVTYFNPDEAPFALQFEIRRGELTSILYITDPQTKATQRLEIDNSLSKEEIQGLIAQAIYDLSHPVVVSGGYNPEVLLEGNIYALRHKEGTYLSLSTRLVDLPQTGFADNTPVIDAYRIIGGKSEEATITMEMLGLFGEEVGIATEVSGTQLKVTFMYKDINYTANYPQKEGETREETANRLLNEHVLERDLLLAKSHFTRELEKRK